MVLNNHPLIDTFGRFHSYLRISVTDRCNFRCVYCMPEEGIDWKPRKEILKYEEIIRLAKIFVANGVTKIRLTGGEPTIRAHIETLIEGLAEIDGLQSLTMTTNGYSLKKNAALYQLVGLTGINISLDTLNPKRFVQITRRPYFNQVMEGIDKAIEIGFHPLKLNVVLMKGVNDDEVLDFVEFVKGRPLNVRFIEFMPFKSNGWNDQQLVPYADLKQKIDTYYPLQAISQAPSEVAKDFAIEGFQGTVSFITSMTNNFCETCNRIRLTAEGSIKSCLFSNSEFNLRDVMRSGCSDAEILKRIHQAILLKQEGHASLIDLPKIDNRSMVQIGG